MKYRLFFLCLITASNMSWSQFNEDAVINIPNDDKLPLNWGYFVGFNQLDYQTSYLRSGLEETQILVEKQSGFHVGLIGEMRLNNFLDLRLEPGFRSGKRNLIFRHPSLVTESDSLRAIKSTFIDLPLLLKFSSNRIANWRPFLIGGPYVSMNLSSNEDSIEDNYSGTFKTTTWNYGYQIGVGIDFYLPYFKFTPSLRGVFALNDNAIRDANPNSPWTANIDKMQSRALLLVFTFE
ncbi:PorT family protein [Flavobacteriaceae bacterium LSUCC0859]|nr:PorT family protein [Flavobacteriaceae bacterium LSUCC0859]